MRYRDGIHPSASADLRGFAKVGVLLPPAAAVGAFILDRIGASLTSRRVVMGFWFPVAVMVLLVLGGAAWRFFWRLELSEDALTWRMLTRRYTLPLAAIQRVTEEVSIVHDSHEVFVTVRANGHEPLRLGYRSWKETELRAVLRALRQRRAEVPFDPAVLAFLDDSTA